jgi:hypothetical protein
MAAWNLTVNLGSNEEGQTRRQSYEKAAAKKKVALGEWVKNVLDNAAGINIKVVKEK